MENVVNGIAHTALTVSDMEASLTFYERALGFERAFEMHDQNDRPHIVYVYAGGGQFIELFYAKPGQEKTQGGIGFNHLCFSVPDIQAVADRIVASGYSLDVPPKTGRDRNRQCWTHDPDGNRIELMQLSEDSRQMQFIRSRTGSQGA